MMYLANDLVQNSRKKYPEISKEFGTIMKAVFTHLVGLSFDGKTQKSINSLGNLCYEPCLAPNWIETTIKQKSW